MQGRTDWFKQVDDRLAGLENYDKDAAYPYHNLVTDLNILRKQGELDKSLRAFYRQRLSDVLSTRINQAIAVNHIPSLESELRQLRDIVRRTKILRGSGGYFRLSEQKTAVKEINALIAKLYEVIIPTLNGGVALCMAARYGDLVRVERLIGEGVGVDSKGDTSLTPLFEAAYEGHDDVVAYLISQNANIHWKVEIQRYTSLMVAAQEGHLSIVQRLLAHNANINDSVPLNGGVTPLHLAAESKRLSVVKYLVENGANLSPVTSNGPLPLSTAIYHNSYQKGDAVIEFLLKAMIRNAKLLDGNTVRPAGLVVQNSIYSLVIAALNHEDSKIRYDGTIDLRCKVRSWLVEALIEKASTVKGDLENLKAELDGLDAILAGVNFLTGAFESDNPQKEEKQQAECIKKLQAVRKQLDKKVVEAGAGGLQKSGFSAFFGALFGGEQEGVKPNLQDPASLRRKSNN